MSEKLHLGVYRESAQPTCNECQRWLYGGPPMFDVYHCTHPSGDFTVTLEEASVRRHDRCPLRGQ